MIQRLKQRLINWLLKNYVRVILPHDIITDVKGVLYLGTEKMTEQDLRILQAEIKALDSMRLWSIINETVRSKAFEKGWTTATTLEHLNTAKTMYHVLDLQKSIVDIIRKKVA